MKPGPASAETSDRRRPRGSLRTTGVILCGGRGSRLGGADKPLEHFRGRPLVAAVAERLAPQVGTVLISANRHLDRYARYGRVVHDRLPAFSGPLGGIHAALPIAGSERLFVCPGDAPGLPHDMVARLEAAMDGASSAADAAVAHDGERRQPLFLLLRARCGASLAEYLDAGHRSVHGWLRRLHVVEVTVDDPEAFRNLNVPEDFQYP